MHFGGVLSVNFFLITLFFRIIILDHEHRLKSLWRVSGVHTILLFAHWVINNYEFNISFLIEKKGEEYTNSFPKSSHQTFPIGCCAPFAVIYQ